MNKSIFQKKSVIFGLLILNCSFCVQATYFGVRNLSKGAVTVKYLFVNDNAYIGNPVTVTIGSDVENRKFKVDAIIGVAAWLEFQSPAMVYEYGYGVGNSNRYLRNTYSSEEFVKQFNKEKPFNVPNGWVIDFLIYNQGVSPDVEAAFKIES